MCCPCEQVLQCVDREAPAVTQISGHVNVTRRSVRALQAAIRRRAPTVVIVDAKCKSFVFYKEGVLYDDKWYVNGIPVTSRIILI